MHQGEVQQVPVPEGNAEATLQLAEVAHSGHPFAPGYTSRYSPSTVPPDSPSASGGSVGPWPPPCWL